MRGPRGARWVGLGSSEGEGELRGPQAPGERGHRPLTCGRGFFTVLVVVVILSVPIIIAVLKWEQAGFGLRAGGGGRAGALEGEWGRRGCRRRAWSRRGAGIQGSGAGGVVFGWGEGRRDLGG